MKTILLPTDFSDESKNAIRYAINLYGTQDVRYIALHAYDLQHHNTTMMISLDDVLKKDALEAMDMEQAWLKKEYAGQTLPLTPVVQKGELPLVLEKVIAHEKADLIIMGTKGASGVSKVLLGSNAVRVIQSAHIPVIAVPLKAGVQPLKKVLLAVDFREPFKPGAAAATLDLCKTHGAELMIVYVSETGELSAEAGENKGKWEAALASLPHSIHVIRAADVTDGLETLASEHKPDMIAMTAGEGGFFRRMFHHSDTKEMVQHAHLPLMIMHNA
ncbi:MAG: universal stress protein [Flavobacteriales bacterium]|nr:universal stress protein [Flavobacteriales bacterium]MCB9448638.1 universal stress protein [Flavobacteriales bacterium]